MKVSVVIPVYNVGDYIKECLDSVFCNKSCQFDLEVIVVDDGSFDETKGILDEYSKCYDFTYLYQDNAGQSAARNVGKSIATGEYLLFVDADDVINPNLISRCLRIFAEYNVDMVAFDGTAFFDSNVNLDDIDNDFNDLSRAPELYNLVMNTRDFFNVSVKKNCFNVQPCLYVVKSKKVCDVFFENGIVYEDNLYTTDVLLNSSVNNIFCLEEKLYQRRVRNNSTVTMKKNLNHFFSYLVVYDTLVSRKALLDKVSMYSTFCSRILALAGKEISLLDELDLLSRIKLISYVLARCFTRPKIISLRVLASIFLGKGYVYLVNFLKREN